jgi:hypothetical protein
MPDPFLLPIGGVRGRAEATTLKTPKFLRPPLSS